MFWMKFCHIKFIIRSTVTAFSVLSCLHEEKLFAMFIGFYAVLNNFNSYGKFFFYYCPFWIVPTNTSTHLHIVTYRLIDFLYIYQSKFLGNVLLVIDEFPTLNFSCFPKKLLNEFRFYALSVNWYIIPFIDHY